MEYVVVDGPQWGIEFDEPLYSLKDWGSVSSYIDHGDGDESDAGVNGATSSSRNGPGARSVHGNARASAEAASDLDDGSNDSSGKSGGSEGAHGANCVENEGNGVRNDDQASIRGDVNGLSRSSNSNQADGAEQEVNFDSKHDRSDGEIRSIRDDVNCAEGAEQDVNFGSKTNEHEDDLKGVNCGDVNFGSKTNEHDREGMNCAEGAERGVNFDSKTNEHREDDLKGVNYADGAEQDNEHDRSGDEIDSIRDDLNGVNCAKGAEGGMDVDLNSEHDRQSDGTADPRFCAQTGNDDIRKRLVDSQKDEVIPDTEEAGEHNEFGFPEDGFLTPKPLKVVPPPRKRARTQQKEKKEKEKGKGKEKEKQAKKQKAKGEKLKANEQDTNQCEICKKTFKHSWRLKEHRVVHSDEKQFVCNFPGCDSKYKRKSDLNIHMARLH